ncbi:transmembrane protein 14Cb [Astyanax mexicanus]|uniref:Transmembrane protein 14C n=1 Tax=Astyanax mexicanus TaxID=7994 RepID=A0A8B9GRH3_ASTMX|nr:transmembrane protein 14Cb [Astyanax mexicanus]KAG9275801.1 transmembrane protein 14C-like [Astyanax mexicanus]
MAADWLGYGYAALVALGGAIGYINAGSMMSLIAGLVFGVLAAIGSRQISQNPRNVWLSLGTYGTLAVVMGVRFLNSWKVMPAGIMTGTSLFMFVRAALIYLWQQKKST